MDGCAFKESKWRKNTCATCFQARSAHGNVSTSPVTCRPPSTINGVPRSESWEGGKGYSTLPNRNSKRYSTGSSISSDVGSLQRRNSTLSTGSGDVSKSSADRMLGQDDSEATTAQSTKIENLSSTSKASQISKETSGTGLEMDSSSSRGAIGRKPLPPRKPSTRPAPPRPSKPADVAAYHPTTASTTTPVHSSKSGFGVEGGSSSSQAVSHQAERSSEKPGARRESGGENSLGNETDGGQSSGAGSSTAASPGSKSGGRGRTATPLTLAPRPAARSSLRSPNDSTTCPPAAGAPPTPTRRSGSARRPSDEKTRAVRTTSSSSSSTTTAEDTGGNTPSTRSTPNSSTQQASVCVAPGSVQSSRSSSSSGANNSSISRTASRSSAGTKEEIAISRPGGDGIGRSDSGKPAAPLVAAAVDREVKTVAQDSGLGSATATTTSSNSRTMDTNGVRGDSAVTSAGTVSSCSASTSNSSGNQLGPTAHLASNQKEGSSPGSGDEGKKRAGPAKPSRSKVSYTSSPDLLRAHSSKLELARKSPTASPAKPAGNAYEEIWRATEAAASTNGSAQQRSNGNGGSPAVHKGTLSPGSSDLDKMMSGTSTDLDVIVSGKKRPAPASPPTRQTASGKDTPQSSPGDHGNADTESLYSVPGEIRPFSPSDYGSDGVDGGGDGEYKALRPAGDYNVPRPASSSALRPEGSTAISRSVSEAQVFSTGDARPKAPTRSLSKPTISKPPAQPPPPPPSSTPPTKPSASNGVTARKQSVSSDDNSPLLTRSSPFDRSKRHTISGRPNRNPPPPPPPDVVVQQDESSPAQERRKSIATPPPGPRKFTGSDTAPASLDILMKIENESGSSMSRLTPKIGTKVWKNIRKTHERTMSLIRQHKPSRRSARTRLDMSDDDQCPSSREPSRAPSAMDAASDAEIHANAGTSGYGAPETPRTTPPRKPLRTANSFKRTRKTSIDPLAHGSPTSTSTAEYLSSFERASSNDTTHSNDTTASESATSTISLRSLLDSALADLGDSPHANTLPLPPKPVRNAAKPANDGPALPPRKPSHTSPPGVPPHSSKPATATRPSPVAPVPNVQARHQTSPPAVSESPSPVPRDTPTSATPVPHAVDSEVELELSLMRSDYHALARSSHRGLSNVVKRLSRCVCNERQKPSGAVPKSWSQIEVLGCEDDGPHGTCSIHISFKGRDGKVALTAQLEPMLTGCDDDAKLYSQDCKVRADLPPHANIIRTQAKFTQAVPEIVREMLELGIPAERDCMCYFTESTADYVDAEIYFSSLSDQDSTSSDTVQQTAFVFVQICLALQHLAFNGVVHRNLHPSSVMIGPVSDAMSPIRSGDRVLLTSFGHALSRSSATPGQCSGESHASKLRFKRSEASIVDVRRTDILPPEIRLDSRTNEQDYTGCDAYALGMLMRSVVDCSVSVVLKRVCDRLCCSKMTDRMPVTQALRVFQCMMWGPSEAEVPGWSSAVVPLDLDRLCAWLDIQRSERLGVLSLKLARFKISLEDYLQCSFLVNITMDELVTAQECFSFP